MITLEFNESDKPTNMGGTQTFTDDAHFSSWMEEHSKQDHLIPDAELIDSGKKMRFRKGGTVEEPVYGYATISR